MKDDSHTPWWGDHIQPAPQPPDPHQLTYKRLLKLSQGFKEGRLTGEEYRREVVLISAEMMDLDDPAWKD